MTIDAELREKLERAQRLMSHSKYAEQVFGREHVEHRIRAAQNSSRACGAASTDARAEAADTTPSDPPAAAMFDRALAMAKLKSMGIRRRDARRALRVVTRRLREKAAPAPSLDEVVHEAIGVLG